MRQVPVSELRPRVDPAGFAFATTAEVEPHVGLVGQERAVAAIKFGLSIEGQGFNIVVAGEQGTGRTTAIREYLEVYSRAKAPPDEWCYVYNFLDPHSPDALRLPPSKGRSFKTSMASMVTDAKERIPRTFQADDYVNRRDEIVTSVQRQRDNVFSQLAEQARQGGFLLQGNPAGFFLVPLAGDKPMDDGDFASLPLDQRDSILEERERLMDQLRATMKQEQGFEAAATDRINELQRTIATMVVDTLLDSILDEYDEFSEVTKYLLEVRRDMIENIDDFLPKPPQPAPPIPIPVPLPQTREPLSPLRKYEVNLLVDCTDETCATVVFEANPTPQRLFGRIEKEAIFGALTTDFTMIQAGSIHRANGGYLVVDLDDLLQYPLSWNELKRALRTGLLTIEEMGDRLGAVETKTVRPEPIPWEGKVVLVAREPVYRMLYSGDPDFHGLFKVKADFDQTIDRTPQHEREYAGLIAAVTKREKLLPLDRSAVARVIEEGMRLAADHNKLSVRFGDITDVIREASFWASQAAETVVTAAHVSKAVQERISRVNLIEEHVREAMEKNIIVVDTDGEAIGQVNGLSVVDLSDTAFGQPSRITASIGMGREGLLDLQRESKLSGPIHSKAVLTLQGFLVDRYAVDAPLTLAARIAFEQSYGFVEGDSATVAEGCALLSRIAEAPVKQSLAITGSMDQKGEVQAIGGANQKIEGFYDVCRLRGLTGDQGVIVPASNVQHLMLREDVVEAVREGKFAVYAIETLDEALELLTGVAAGSKREDGSYPPDTINGRVQARLKEMTEKLRALDNHHWPDDEATNDE